MLSFILAIFSQVIPFLPLALGVSISYTLLRATDLSLDGSFVLGAVLFARLVTLGMPPIFACIIACLGGMLVGICVSMVQQGGKIDSLLAGVLIVFILTSVNLIILTKPNISLLSTKTLFSAAFAHSEFAGWTLVCGYCIFLILPVFLLIQSRFGLYIRALGDNPQLFARMGYPIESFRAIAFALTNMLAAFSGTISAQIFKYADISMGLGMTLTGICAILLGQQFLKFFIRNSYTRGISEFFACLFGVCIYFLGINFLLRLDINPIYLKMALGIVLICFIRILGQSQTSTLKNLSHE